MTQEFVTLPREVVEQALDALDEADLLMEHRQDIELRRYALVSLRAALEQPKNHVSDAGNMVPAGWKLVPDEPTQEMLEAGNTAHYDAENRINSPGAWEKGGFASRVVRARHVFQAMLAAAPQPPTTEQSSAVEQQQGEQEPLQNGSMPTEGTPPVATGN